MQWTLTVLVGQQRLNIGTVALISCACECMDNTQRKQHHNEHNKYTLNTTHNEHNTLRNQRNTQGTQHTTNITHYEINETHKEHNTQLTQQNKHTTHNGHNARLHQITTSSQSVAWHNTRYTACGKSDYSYLVFLHCSWKPNRRHSGVSYCRRYVGRCKCYEVIAYLTPHLFIYTTPISSCIDWCINPNDLTNRLVVYTFSCENTHARI